MPYEPLPYVTPLEAPRRADYDCTTTSTTTAYVTNPNAR